MCVCVCFLLKISFRKNDPSHVPTVIMVDVTSFGFFFLYNTRVITWLFLVLCSVFACAILRFQKNDFLGGRFSESGPCMQILGDVHMI